MLILRFASCVRVALHAQVSPEGNNQIVGSVMTTDGLRAALTKRHDIESVDVFYPSSYKGFLDSEWDLIVIEGWFSSINEFLQLTRNRFPAVKIVYFCLDPAYPPLSSLINFDIDGLLSNSEKLLELAKVALPKGAMLLAADSELMRPIAEIERQYGAVYVGAGGGMLAYKPGLHRALLDALPFGLRLHGSSWGHVEHLGAVWRGLLPRHDLAVAYASAHVVISFTIAAQAQLGMINNRVFEALACGAVLVSDHSEALASLLTNRGDRLLDLVLFVNESHPVSHHIEHVLQHREHYEEVRRQARQFVLQRHTWAHRAVQLTSFYQEMQESARLLAATGPTARRCCGWSAHTW